jgi:hypothetical protein
MRVQREGAAFRTIGASRPAVVMMTLVLLCACGLIVWLAPVSIGPVLGIGAIGSLGYASGYRRRRNG